MLEEYKPKFKQNDEVSFNIRGIKYRGSISGLTAYDIYQDMQTYQIRSGPSYFIRHEDQIEFLTAVEAGRV